MIKNQFRIYVKLDIDMHMNRQSDINLFNNMPNLMRKLVFFLALQISLFPYQLSQQICFKKSQLSQNKIEVERKRQHFFMHQWRWWRRDGWRWWNLHWSYSNKETQTSFFPHFDGSSSSLSRTLITLVSNDEHSISTQCWILKYPKGKCRVFFN